MIAMTLAAAVAAAHPAIRCERYVVEPTPEQGMADAALVRKASGHDASPRSLGTAMAMGTWRVVWARPEDSEGGVFFFHGPRGAERFVNVWGGPTSDRAAAFRWARTTVRAPVALSRCFAARLVANGS